MKVYVFQGYFPTGGAYMAYELARICHECFKVPVVVVGSKPSESHPFSYPHRFPLVTREEMERTIRPDDLLICNPSFSKHEFGRRLKCRKLMYIQGTTTFEALDRHFDYYVSVSEHVRHFIEKHYRLKTPVIRPYIRLDLFNKGRRWAARSDEILVFNYKPQTMPCHERLLRVYRDQYPRGRAAFRMIERMPQERLARFFGRHKYYLTLSPSEGFGLPALEAMASGCVVLGFDGGGGNEYFRPGTNAFVAPFPDYRQVADALNRLETEPEAMEPVAAAAAETAKEFSRDRFESLWRQYLKQHIFS